MGIPFYNQAARFYDRIWRNFTQVTLNQSLAALDIEALERANLEPCLLDIGCGTGEFEVCLSKLHPEIRVVAIDNSAKMLEQSRRKLYGDSRVSFLQADANHPLPFPDNTFDAVVSNNVLHYFSQPLQTFQEMRRVLKSGGQLIIEDFTVHGHSWPVFEQLIKIADGLHHKTYTLLELNQLLQEAAFRINQKGEFDMDATWRGMFICATKP